MAAGMAFGFCAFRSSVVFFPNLIHTEWLCFYLWALLRSLRTLAPKDFVLAGGFAGLCLYSSYTHVVMMALVSIPLALLAFRTRSHPRRAQVRMLVVGVLLVAGTTSVLGVPIFTKMKAELDAEGPYHALGGAPTRAEGNPIVGMIDPRYHEPSGTKKSRRANFLGVGTLALVLVGCFTLRKSRPFWVLLVTAFGFLVLSLGSHLNFDAATTKYRDVQDPLLLPYYYLQTYPLFSSLRVPHRFGIVGALLLVIPAAMTLERLLNRVRAVRLRTGLTAVAIAIPFVEMLRLPFAGVWPVPPPPDALVRMVPASNSPALKGGCVLEFPRGRRGYLPFAYFGTVHKRPVCLGGSVARTSLSIQQSKRKSSLRKSLERAYRGKDLTWIPSPSDLHAIQKEAQDLDVRWVMLAWSAKRYPPPTPEKLEHVDQIVRLVFDIEDTLLHRASTEMREWYATQSEQPSHAVYRIYRVQSKGE